MEEDVELARGGDNSGSPVNTTVEGRRVNPRGSGIRHSMFELYSGADAGCKIDGLQHFWSTRPSDLRDTEDGK